LWLAAGSAVEAGCSPFGCIPLDLAFSDLPGDPSGDVAAGWWRAERINLVCDCGSGMVDSGGLRRAAVESGGEAIESIVATA